jgi:hypothetical protein
MKYINELKEEATFTINNERVLNSNKFAEVLLDKCICLLKHNPEAIETLLTEFELSDELVSQDVKRKHKKHPLDWVLKY